MISIPGKRNVFADFEHDLTTNFRDDFKGGLNDFKRQLKYFKAELESDLKIELGNQHNDTFNELEKLEALMTEIQYSNEVARDNGTISETISNFRDDFNDGLNDFKRQLIYFKAQLEDELGNQHYDILQLENELEKSEELLKEKIQNSSQIARNNGRLQNRILNRQGGLAVGSGIFFLIAIAVPTLIYIYKKFKKRKLRSNFASLYKRSFHFVPVSRDPFQNSSNDETP